MAARLPGRKVLRLRGEDVDGFLQGLITVDLRELSPDRSLWGALLTPQGRYLFDFFLVREDAGSVLLDCEAARLDELVQRLTLYRLRRRIAIEEAEPAYAVVAIDAAPADFGVAPERGATVRRDGTFLFLDPRLPELGLRALVPAGQVGDFLLANGLEEAPAETFLRRRLQLGVPEGSEDLWPQRSLPLECNFEELGGVSFTKGCFVGQEVTARMHFRAKPRRRLLPAAFPGGTPEPGAPVQTADGREAGTVQRVHEDLGLVLLRVEHLSRPEAAPFSSEGVRIEPNVPAWLGLQEKNPLQAGPPGV